MSPIVTLYLSMLRQNASGSNCGMITTGTPDIIWKGRHRTAPGTDSFGLAAKRGEWGRRTVDVPER